MMMTITVMESVSYIENSKKRIFVWIEWGRGGSNPVHSFSSNLPGLQKTGQEKLHMEIIEVAHRKNLS